MLGVRRTAVAAVLALVLCAPARGALAPGIDVSHWQGSIDWLGVVAQGHTFVFAKATEGTSAVDATYALNRSGAQSTGLRVGAYHFARPAGSGDAGIVANAVAQADNFVNFAQPKAGDLPPVLDLEATGNLSPTALSEWTQAWLDHVEARTGVKPVIYGSPNFWKTRLADSSAFAGYPLWVAHWTSSSSPLVPAANWGGRGWTFWQWSDCLKIPGVTAKCTDGDRFNGGTTAPLAIPAAGGGAPVTALAPAVVGTPQAGKLLAATVGRWNGARPVSFSYQWQRCDAAGAGCLAIAAATKESYTPVAADVGHALVATVTAKGAAGTSSVPTRPTIAVAAAGATTATAPVATALPSVQGTPVAGQTLTASAGTWTGSPTAFAFQWRRCDATGGVCEAIAGAAGSQYVVGPADIGATLSLVVTATGKGGSRSAVAPTTPAVAAATVSETAVGTGTVTAGAAGAVTTTDHAATVSWQPGALAVGAPVTLQTTTAKLPTPGSVVRLALPTTSWPVDLQYAAAPADAVVGLLPGPGVWQAVPALTAPQLPDGQASGSYRDAGGVLHVLLRGGGTIGLFEPGAWGDPRRVPTVKPTLNQLAAGDLKATHAADGSIRVVTRLYASSQVKLTAAVVGPRGTIVQQGSRLSMWLHGAPRKTVASQLGAPGTFPVRLKLQGTARTVKIRVTATDPYGRHATALLVVR